MVHNFHIPVLGLGFSIDTPLKVAKYGISSVVSVVDDELIERMRALYANKNNEEFIPIGKKSLDSRSRRITCYLNMLQKIVDQQFETLKKLPFRLGNDICRYFDLLPDQSQLKQGYELMMDYPEGESKRIFQKILKSKMEKGAIDVNIMAKVNKMNFDYSGEFLGDKNNDAMAALRGFGLSRLNSSLVLSAGMNTRLYSYIEDFEDFFPNENGEINKKIILKVSDFRSAFTQAKFLAKKGLWVSEFRVESGLNCGGHAFATEGYLLGPILEEFKQKKEMMHEELIQLYNAALLLKGITKVPVQEQKLSVQGGIGTSFENEYLLKNYKLNSTGWGSPFLLVPEVTNVDIATLNELTKAKVEDFYLSNSSPLGVLFNNFKYSSISKQRDERIAKGRPGSPCTKKLLVTNTEFTAQPICTASREYQNLKIKQLESYHLPEIQFSEQYDAITEKVCLCEGLCSSVYIKNDILKPKENKAVAICPGPNLAYFSKVYSLDDMVNHIYGKVDLLETIARPHCFVKELNLYIDYLQTEIKTHIKDLNDKKLKYLNNFKFQLQEGIDYYKNLINEKTSQALLIREMSFVDLDNAEIKLKGLLF